MVYLLMPFFTLFISSSSPQGYVELTIFPTVVNLNRIKLNSKQCRIYRVRVNDLEAPFLYNDPTLEVCHHESKQWVLLFIPHFNDFLCYILN